MDPNVQSSNQHRREWKSIRTTTSPGLTARITDKAMAVLIQREHIRYQTAR